MVNVLIVLGFFLLLRFRCQANKVSWACGLFHLCHKLVGFYFVSVFAFYLVPATPFLAGLGCQSSFLFPLFLDISNRSLCTTPSSSPSILYLFPTVPRHFFLYISSFVICHLPLSSFLFRRFSICSAAGCLRYGCSLSCILYCNVDLVFVLFFLCSNLSI